MTECLQNLINTHKAKTQSKQSLKEPENSVKNFKERENSCHYQVDGNVGLFLAFV